MLADATRIGRLRVRGPAGSAPRVAGSLDRAAWPRTGPGEVLFVRSLRVQGAADEIGARAAELVARLAGRAADGWSAGAADAEAVGFASGADLLACLVRDLLLGHQRWYWRDRRELFALPRGEAAARALLAAPLSLPGVLARAEPAPWWGALWAALAGAPAASLFDGVVAAAGWDLPRARAPLPEAGPDPSNQSNQSNQPDQSNRPDPRDPHPVPPLPEAADEDDPSLRLAALLLAWRREPAALTGAGAGRRFAARCRTLARRLGPGAPAGGVPGEPRLPSHPKPGPPGHGLADPPARGHAPPDRVAPDAGAWAPAPGPGEATAVTRAAGLFYLLNFLNLRGAQALLAPRDAEGPGAGWRWLARLASALGLAPDPALARLLAAEADLPSPAHLAALPPLAREPELLRLGEARYGPALWHAGPFAVPGVVRLTRTHLDVAYRLADARVEVRRAGLDLDPGWLPWLGRAVAFRFGHPPELAAGDPP